MFDDDAVAPDHTARTTGLIAQFKREITSTESRLSSAVKMTPARPKVVSEEGREVTHDDFLSWLQFCVTGLHHPVMLPSNPMYLDAVIGGQGCGAASCPRSGASSSRWSPSKASPWSQRLGALGPGRAAQRIPLVEPLHLHGSARVLEAPGQVPQEVEAEDSRLLRSGVQHEYRLDQPGRGRDGRRRRGGHRRGQQRLGGGRLLHQRGRADGRGSGAPGGLRAPGRKAVNRLAFAARIETINTLDAYLGSFSPATASRTCAGRSSTR